MKIMTKEVEKKLMKHPLGSMAENEMEAEVILKVFNPYGKGTWLITEASKEENGKWLAFGVVNLVGDYWEWGYIDLDELATAKINFFGHKMDLERDKYCDGYTVEQCMNF